MTNERERLEKELSEALTEGKMVAADPVKEAVDRLSPRYEAIVRAETDPIAEETRLYREMAEEIDDRYDSAKNDVNLQEFAQTSTNPREK